MLHFTHLSSAYSNFLPIIEREISRQRSLLRGYDASIWIVGRVSVKEDVGGVSRKKEGTQRMLREFISLAKMGMVKDGCESAHGRLFACLCHTFSPNFVPAQMFFLGQPASSRGSKLSKRPWRTSCSESTRCNPRPTASDWRKRRSVGGSRREPSLEHEISQTQACREAQVRDGLEKRDGILANEASSRPVMQDGLRGALASSPPAHVKPLTIFQSSAISISSSGRRSNFFSRSRTPSPPT